MNVIEKILLLRHSNSIKKFFDINYIRIRVDKLEDAVKVRKQKAKELYGEFYNEN
jgi:hypothetical protein